jgi:hypothetical protein
MAKMIQHFSEQLEKVLALAKHVCLAQNNASYRSIFIARLGGGRISDALGQELVLPECELPIFASKGYVDSIEIKVIVHLKAALAKFNYESFNP